MKKKEINIPIFEIPITIVYGYRDEIYDLWNSKYPDLMDSFGCFTAKYWSIQNMNNIKWYILIVKKEGEGDVYHESLHATNDILDFVGVKVDNHNDEIQCYLMEYIAKKVLETLNKWKDG